MNNNNIEKTIEFLREQYNKNKYYREHKDQKDYRFEHSLRVTNIGIEIAQNENFDVEVLAIGCILHDVSYMNDFNSEEDWLNHGRNSAIIARKYLESLGLSEEKISEICYGIAIHVDDKSDFGGDRTPVALSIGDSDNIDRFDTYRIYETLQSIEFSKMELKEKLKYVNSVLEKLNKYIDMQLATNTAINMWRDKVGFQIAFFKRLEKQLKDSNDLYTVRGTVPICSNYI